MAVAELVPPPHIPEGVGTNAAEQESDDSSDADSDEETEETKRASRSDELKKACVRGSYLTFTCHHAIDAHPILPADRATAEPTMHFCSWLHSRKQTVQSYNYSHGRWAEFTTDVLHNWLFLVILEGDHEAVRAATKLRLRNHDIQHLNCPVQINMMYWRNRAGDPCSSWQLTPLQFACLLGRSSCVRVMLEEFPSVFRPKGDEGITFDFMGCKLSLPMALHVIPVFQPILKMGRLQAFCQIRENNKVYEITKRLTDYCKADARGQAQVLDLHMRYFPRAKWLRDGVTFPDGTRYALFTALCLSNIRQGFFPPNKPHDLADLASVSVAQNIPTEKLRAFRESVAGHLPPNVIDKICDKAQHL